MAHYKVKLTSFDVLGTPIEVQTFVPKSLAEAFSKKRKMEQKPLVKRVNMELLREVKGGK